MHECGAGWSGGAPAHGGGSKVGAGAEQPAKRIEAFCLQLHQREVCGLHREQPLQHRLHRRDHGCSSRGGRGVGGKIESQGGTIPLMLKYTDSTCFKSTAWLCGEHQRM